MKGKIWLLISIISLSLIIISCKDDEAEVKMVNPELKVKMSLGSSDFIEGGVYEINSTLIKIVHARFYLGGITLRGTSESSKDEYYVVSDDPTTISFDEISEGEYDLEFAIGIDSVTNNQTTEDFTTRPVGDPLGLQEPEMHWNWNSGYKFLRIDATVDTDADGLVDKAVQYHLGGNEYYAPLSAPDKITVSQTNKDISMNFDIAALFKDIDISKGEITHGGSNKPLADQLFANYTEAISISN